MVRLIRSFYFYPTLYVAVLRCPPPDEQPGKPRPIFGLVRHAQSNQYKVPSLSAYYSPYSPKAEVNSEHSRQRHGHCGLMARPRLKFKLQNRA